MKCFVKDCHNEPCGFLKGDENHSIAYCPDHEKIINEALAKYDETDGESLKKIYEYKGNT